MRFSACMRSCVAVSRSWLCFCSSVRYWLSAEEGFILPFDFSSFRAFVMAVYRDSLFSVSGLEGIFCVLRNLLQALDNWLVSCSIETIWLNFLYASTSHCFLWSSSILWRRLARFSVLSSSSRLPAVYNKYAVYALWLLYFANSSPAKSRMRLKPDTIRFVLDSGVLVRLSAFSYILYRSLSKHTSVSCAEMLFAGLFVRSFVGFNTVHTTVAKLSKNHKGWPLQDAY